MFVWRRVQREQLAADITSNVFLKAMLNLKRYKSKGLPFSSWLYRIALNETNMYFRKAGRQREVFVNVEELQLVAREAESGTSDTQLEKLVQAMEKLPSEQAQLIELRFFEQYSFKEIGAMLNLEEATAKMRVYRVMKRLRKLMGEKGGQA